MTAKIGNHMDVLRGDIRALEQQLNAARSHLRQLDSQMEQLNGMWSGPAHDAMRQRARRDLEEMSSLCRFLAEFINYLETVRKSYEVCEGSVSDTVAAIHID